MATVYVSGNPPFTTPPPEPWVAEECYSLSGPSRDNWNPLCINERINGEYENKAKFWYDAQPTNAFTRDFDWEYGEEVTSVQNNIQLYDTGNNRLQTTIEKPDLVGNVNTSAKYFQLNSQTNSSISGFQFDGDYMEYLGNFIPKLSMFLEFDSLSATPHTQTILQSRNSDSTSHKLYYSHNPSGASAIGYDVSDGTNSYSLNISIDLTNNLKVVLLIDYNEENNEIYLSMNCGDGNIYTDTTIGFTTLPNCAGMILGNNESLTEPFKGRVGEIYNYGSTLV